MSKTYPLVIEEWEEAWVSKGHHSPDAFIAAIVALGYVEEGDLQPEDVLHRWYRHDVSRSGGYDRYYSCVDGPGRGVFPVTVCD
jgi:hypothetical protein